MGEVKNQPDRDSRLQAILDNMVDAVITIDEQGVINSVNKAALGMFGYEPDELTDRNVNILMPDIFAREHDRYIDNYNRTNEAKIIGIGREILGQRKDNSIFPAELAVSEVRIDGQRYFTGILRDISERKQAEKELQQAHYDLREHAGKLERANEMLSEFAYAVSHDLKAPLRAIRNYTDFLSEDLGETLAEDHLSYLSGLRTATREADDLVEDLLIYCEVSTKTQTLEEIDLGDLVRGVIDRLPNTGDVEIKFEGSWPVVETAPSLIRQVIQNLVTNAVKFGPAENKRVELGCRPADEGGLEIWVRDNGIGIEARFFEQIYEIFKRLHTKAEYEGTGIGLAIVKQAVNRLNGTLRLESEPGAGSCFFVYLPLRGLESAHDR